MLLFFVAFSFCVYSFFRKYLKLNNEKKAQTGSDFLKKMKELTFVKRMSKIDNL